jgi:hypothetical protein
VAYCALVYLTPYKGTPLYDQLAAEGRLLNDRGMAYYNGYNVTFQPKVMSPSELLQAHRALWHRAFSPVHVLRRIVKATRYLRPGALMMTLAMNGFYGLKRLRGNTPLVVASYEDPNTRAMDAVLGAEQNAVFALKFRQDDSSWIRCDG